MIVRPEMTDGTPNRRRFEERIPKKIDMRKPCLFTRLSTYRRGKST